MSGCRWLSTPMRAASDGPIRSRCGRMVPRWQHTLMIRGHAARLLSANSGAAARFHVAGPLRFRRELDPAAQRTECARRQCPGRESANAGCKAAECAIAAAAARRGRYDAGAGDDRSATGCGARGTAGYPCAREQTGDRAQARDAAGNGAGDAARLGRVNIRFRRVAACDHLMTSRARSTTAFDAVKICAIMSCASLPLTALVPSPRLAANAR